MLSRKGSCIPGRLIAGLHAPPPAKRLMGGDLMPYRHRFPVRRLIPLIRHASELLNPCAIRHACCSASQPAAPDPASRDQPSQLPNPSSVATTARNRPDALHTMKATADHIHERGGEFVPPVKENRRALFDALDALPCDQIPVGHTATGKGHGRITIRTIQVLPAPDDLPFPHVSQMFLIERYVTGLRANRSGPSPRSASRVRKPGR